MTKVFTSKEAEQAHEAAVPRLRKYPRIQIVAIEELLSGKCVEAPSFATGQGNITLKRAPVTKVRRKDRTKATRLREYQSDGDEQANPDETELWPPAQACF